MVIDVRHILIVCEFSDSNEVKDEGGGGQGKREVGDEGRDMEMRGREEGEGRIIWGKGRGKRGKFCAALQEEKKKVRARGDVYLPVHPSKMSSDVPVCVSG